MKLDDYYTLWEKDSIIDADNVGAKSLEIHRLHAKYLRYHSDESLRLKRLIEQKKKIERQLEGYYETTIDGRDIGKEPYLGTVPKTKESLRRMIEADETMIKFNLALIQQEEIYSYLTEVVRSIHQMSYNCKNFVEYMKFMNGVG